MSDKTGIEWTDATWNPIVGCSLVSPGCTNCYAMSMAARIVTMQNRAFDSVEARKRSPYPGTTQPSKAGAVWTGKVALASDDTLTVPLRWKKPRRIFVNSMGDLFHESIPDEWIDRVFAVMLLARRHVFQVLTKRSTRMREYLSAKGAIWRVVGQASKITGYLYAVHGTHQNGGRILLPNVWLGVSAEDQRRADERIPDLLETPAAVRFVSGEPLLAPIDFRVYMPNPLWDDIPSWKQPELDWIIVGGESGPGARPMHPDWARSIRDQCAAAAVPFFFKQWGEWKDGSDFAPDAKAVASDGRILDPSSEALSKADRDARIGNATMMRRVGKRRAGRLLDGREHNEFPALTMGGR